MTNLEEFEYTDIQYDQTSSVEPYLLIAEVKKYPILFDSSMPHFNNLKYKMEMWEKVNAVIFPNYHELPEETKEIIRRTIRKRWKSLRDAVVKDRRFRLRNVEAGKKRVMTAINKEMQFLIPHVKFSGRYSFSNDGKYSPDFCKLLNEDKETIDLTFQEEDTEDSSVHIDDETTVQNEALYPSVHLITPEPDSEEIQQMKENLCFPSEDAYSFPNTQLNNEAFESDDEMKFKHEEEQNFTVNEEKQAHKRRHCDSGREDLELKFNEIIDRYNDETQDEDRMFLLSLLSDFKRVPVNKKLKVKSDFVTALYEALN